VGSLYYAWGMGLVHRWEGDFDAARSSLEAAIELARQRDDHWAEFECCAARMTLELEANDPRAERIGTELVAMAERLGPGGSESVFARALAELAAGNIVGVDRAIADLDRIDAKGLAAQVRGFSAERALEARDVGRADALARRILETAIAEPLDRAKAHVILGSLALDDGDRDAASDAFAQAAALGDDLPPRLRDRMRPR
jgi:tetratricopeptide (TPR) repeat protein